MAGKENRIFQWETKHRAKVVTQPAVRLWLMVAVIISAKGRFEVHSI